MLKRTHSDDDLDANAYDDGGALVDGAKARFETVKRMYNKSCQHAGRYYDNNTLNDHARAHYGDVHNYRLEALTPETPAQKKSRLQAWLGGVQSHSYKHATSSAEAGNDSPTGQWLLDSELYSRWQHEPNSWVWYYGIPGCGKTVLNALAIRDLRERYADHSDHATIHFFFDFNNHRRSDLDSMLRSLISQLNDKLDIVPQEMEDLYTHTCMNGTREPTNDELLQTFRLTLMRFASIFIALDALDEAESEARKLYDTLRKLHMWDMPCVHTLITSRRESSVYDCLEGIVPPEYQVEIQPSNVNGDIEIWLSEQLRNGRLGKRLDKWDDPDSFKTKIWNVLMDRASGMFLLTKLQLDELEHCSSEAEVDAALRDMPRTLKEIFNRIVGKIDVRNRQAAEDILKWLVYAFCPLGVDDVQWIVAFNKNQELQLVLDPKKRMQNGREEVFAKCSSLVRLVKEVDAEEDVWRRTDGPDPGDSSVYYVELAHSTVKEYLICEDRTVDSKIWLNALRPSSCHEHIAQSLLAYLLHFHSAGTLLPGAVESSRYDSLGIYARLFWHDHARLSEMDPRSSSLHAQLQQMIGNPAMMKSSALSFSPSVSETHLPHTVQAMQDFWKSLLDNSFRIVPADVEKLKRSLTQELCTTDLSQREPGPSWKQIECNKRLTRFQLDSGPWSERNLRDTPQHPDQHPSPPSNAP